MRYFFLFFAFSLTLLAQAQNAENLFQKGNEFYQKKEWKSAIAFYDSIVKLGYENSALYYNLGNAHFKANHLAEAILNYERAAQLDRYDDDVQQNLKIAKEATIDRFEEMPKPMVRTIYLSVLKAFSPSGWAWLSVVAFAGLLAGTFLYLFSGKRRLGFVLAVFGFLLGVVFLALAYSHQNYLSSNRSAIVMRPSSYAKSGPSENAEDVFILHEGAKITVTEYFENWKKIKLPDGKVGWIKSGDTVEI